MHGRTVNISNLFVIVQGFVQKSVAIKKSFFLSNNTIIMCYYCLIIQYTLMNSNFNITVVYNMVLKTILLLLRIIGFSVMAQNGLCLYIYRCDFMNFNSSFILIVPLATGNVG